MLSGRGLCDELITCPEESYRLCCVVVCDLETSRMGAPYIYDISRLRVNTVGSLQVGVASLKMTACIKNGEACTKQYPAKDLHKPFKIRVLHLINCVKENMPKLLD